MDSKKFAFIICSNNEIVLNEALYYISTLKIPEGYEVDSIVVKDAISMASGYNEGMHASDAKYKIYIHQDVFIINENFLFELLEIFHDNTIGLVGVVGCDRILDNAKFAASWNLRATYLCNSRRNTLFFDGMKTQKEKIDALFIDGMFMATQYDLDWDEDFDGWDFYDVSQCLRFYEAGYKLAIPCFTKENVWTMHDEGYCVPRHYCKYRKMFCEKFSYYGFLFDEEDLLIKNTLCQLDKAKQSFLIEMETIEKEEGLCLNEKIDWFKNQMYKFNSYTVVDTEISYWNQLIEIDNKEQAIYNESRFWKLGTVSEILQIYHTVKFWIWRMELGKEEKDTETLWLWVKQGLVSVAALSVIVVNTAYEPKKCWEMCTERLKK